MNLFWTSYLTKLFLVIQCSTTQALRGNHESCPVSGRGCSSQVQECPSAVPGTPLEIRTKRNGVFVITGELVKGRHSNSGNAGPDAQWRNILLEEVTACVKKITPGGKEPGNIPQYLCRTIFNSQWMTGKLAVHENNCDFTCDVYVGFTELEIPITNDKPNQILMYQEPTLTWAKYPTDDGGLPDTIANTGQRGEVLPICRHTDEDGSIYLGIFLKHTKQCAFVKGGKGSTANTNIEILAPPPAPKSCLPPTEEDECLPTEPNVPVSVGSVRDGTYYEAGFADKNIGWRTVTGKDIKSCLKIVEPSGMESNNPVHRCRILYSLQWVPGKLMYDETLCKYVCNIYVDEDTSRYPIDDEITQILIETNSITKWVEYKANDPLPVNVINGGGKSQNAVFILCRYKDSNGNTFLGTLFLDFKNCWYINDFVAYPASDGFEVLVSPGVDIDNNCPKQKSCDSATEDLVLTVYRNDISATEAETSEYLKWQTVNAGEIFECLNKTIAHGIEPGPRNQYLCRAFYKNKWVPGKLAPENSTCNAECEIIFGNEIKKLRIGDEYKIQILTGKANLAIWQKASEFDPDSKFVISYENISNIDPMSICRYSDEFGNKYIGHFTPASSYDTCLYQEGEKVSSGRGDNVEILVQYEGEFHYARSFDKRPCADLSTACPNGKGTHVLIGVLNKNAITKTGYARDDIQWRHVAKADVVACLTETTRGGVDKKLVSQYICQTLHNGLWIPGKVTLDEDSCEFTCDIGDDSKTVKTLIDDDQKTQILMFPEAAVSWVKLSCLSDTVNNTIIGGENVNGDLAPVCRFVSHVGEQLIGRFFPACMTCLYTTGDKEISESNPFKIEILLQAVVKHCPEQKATCSSSAGDTVETGVYKNGATKVEAAKEPKWTAVEEDEITACLKPVKPNPQYICRVFYELHWVPGKLESYDDPCDARCDIIVDFKVIKVPFGDGNKIQVFNVGSGSATWNSFKVNTTSIDNFIVGGKNSNEDVIPLCLYKDDNGNKYIGHFALGHSACWYISGDKVSISCNAKRIEILVSGTRQSASNCPTQNPKCTLYKPEAVGIGTVKNKIYHRKRKSGSEMQWNRVVKSEVRFCLNQIAPSGMEANNVSQYICRVLYPVLRIPGILRYTEHNCSFTCDIVEANGVLKVPIDNMHAIQILMYSNESVYWGNLALYPNLPNNMIRGGYTYRASITLVCRYRMEDGTVHVGKFLPLDQSCSIIEGDREVAKTNASNIEIMLSTTNKCQKPVCEHGERETVRTGGVYNGIFQFKGYAANNVQWRFVEQNDVLPCLYQAMPAGMGQNNHSVYICRTFRNETNFWMMGTIHYDENACEFTCDVGTGYKTTKYPIKSDRHTQILMAEKGYTSWIRKSAYPTLPDKLISGGKNIGGEFNPICRVSSGNGDEVYLGQYYPYYGTCWYTNAESEIPDGNLTMEILVEENPSHCQLTFCEHGERESVRTGGVYNGIFQFKEYASKNVQWRFVQQNDVRACLQQTIPAGVGPSNIPVYICRTFRRETKFWMMGTIHFDKNACEFTCDVGTDYKSTKFSIKSDGHTQILVAEKGSTSWIKKSSYPTLPDKLISGGKNIGGEFNPICRVASGNGDEVYLGQYYPFYGTCWYTTSDNEIPDGNSAMEILVEG